RGRHRGAVPPGVPQHPHGAERGRRRHDRSRQADDLRPRRRRLQGAPAGDWKRLPRILRQALPGDDAGGRARFVRRRRRLRDRDRGRRRAGMSAGARFTVKHRLPATRWPTAEEAARSRWFSPASIGALTVAERTWVPAMVPWRATEDGVVTPDVLDWYARFAEGQPGVLVVEATGIRDVASGPLLRIGDDRFIPGLRRLVETVRERSGGRTRLFIQVIDLLAVRRRPEPAKFCLRFLEIDAGLRERLAGAAGDARWLSAAELAVRRRLLEASAADRGLLDRVLTERQREALDYGYRER